MLDGIDSVNNEFSIGLTSRMGNDRSFLGATDMKTRNFALGNIHLLNCSKSLRADRGPGAEVEFKATWSFGGGEDSKFTAGATASVHDDRGNGASIDIKVDDNGRTDVSTGGKTSTR